jgi:hypothetical protein
MGSAGILGTRNNMGEGTIVVGTAMGVNVAALPKFTTNPLQSLRRIPEK